MKKTIASVCLIIVSGMMTQAQNSDAETQLRVKQYNVSSTGLAISGYDPVSYFSNKPLLGSVSYSYKYKGITYRFISAKNMELFKSFPAKYEPAYGGWCAYAMGSSGEKVEIDSQTYKIIGGKLFLFYNSYFNNTLKTWNKNEQNLHAKADANWKKIYH